MYGIDIYNGNKGIDLAKINNIDFCIVKASEGTTLRDKSIDTFVSQIKKLGLLWGFYHYAKNNKGKFDAEFFYKSTKDYFGQGIPVLDYEDSALLNSGKGIQYCEDFCTYIYNKTKIYPAIYCSASVCKTFKNSWIPTKCALWVAGYPRTYTSWIAENTTLPYNIAPWGSAIIWQFSGSGRLSSYAGDLDLNIGYINKSRWGALSKGDTSNKSQEDNIKAACEVILGKWGNGADRKTALEKAGYNYSVVQGLVNQILKM